MTLFFSSDLSRKWELGWKRSKWVNIFRKCFLPRSGFGNVWGKRHEELYEGLHFRPNLLSAQSSSKWVPFSLRDLQHNTWEHEHKSIHEVHLLSCMFQIPVLCIWYISDRYIHIYKITTWSTSINEMYKYNPAQIYSGYIHLGAIF